jgi:hypothetical protein
MAVPLPPSGHWGPLAMDFGCVGKIALDALVKL